MKFVEMEGEFPFMKPVLEKKIVSKPVSHVLPTDFNFVYVYVNLDTDEIAYIGRVDSPHRGGMRLHDHRCESWYKHNKYAIGYIACLNRLESETVETELINRYDPKYNKDKKGWGLWIDAEDEPTGIMDINNMRFLREDMLDKVGVEMLLTEMQDQLKKAMIKIDGWEEAADA